MTTNLEQFVETVRRGMQAAALAYRRQTGRWPKWGQKQVEEE